jgi:hypothetical protein
LEPIIIEVRCNLQENDPRWNDIDTLSLEIGYPSREGRTLWKRIGWLRDQLMPIGKTFSPALWNRVRNRHTLVFDFLPVPQKSSLEPERKYFLRKHITTTDGKSRVSRQSHHQGDFSDDFFTIEPQYP